MSVTATAALDPPQRMRGFGDWGHEGIVLALWLVELVVFALIGHNFATPGNGLEILRTSTEIGLLALALTPVIVTGGIDLSVGSLHGPVRRALRPALARPRPADRSRRRDRDRGGRRWPAP